MTAGGRPRTPIIPAAPGQPLSSPRYTGGVPPASDRLFTPRFLAMCGFSFTVFLSAFQLFPTAPFRILDLGGSRATAGLFLGLLTYASAISGPFTGALADHLGRRRALVACSLVVAAMAAGYGLVTDARLMLGIAVVHGVFWSGLLTASAAYVTDIVPTHRRAEGIGYWGLAATLAVSVAPTIGLGLYGLGWSWSCASVGGLSLVMAAVAWRLPDDRAGGATSRRAGRAGRGRLLEWRVTALAGTLFLYAFGYGGIVSFVALYAEANAISPRGLYFIVFTSTVILTRPFLGRLADRVGHARVLLPMIGAVVAGYALLAAGGAWPWLVASALVFGVGFGAAYPIFVALALHDVAPERRALAFGSILAALDTGIGSGSIVTGAVIERWGYGAAYGTAAALAALAIPYFVAVTRRLGLPLSGP